ncbi:LuxR family transcriptional regulator [Streptomyces sp. NBC_01766]|uniref:LuxR family transcriptional regulator n=1 Tax=Streptomyces sp. NBC_01766 TaxID=2975936 RepID=UPI002DD81888|nr:LuxR family transcriptional regulator [Streptomyces sp. NBC_01766]WSC19243.1 LuxR family transcriptional regulator [Streptomyces sp. NBC_01766]
MSPQHRAPGPADPDGDRVRLVERAAESAALREAVRQVAGGGSATVVVHGPPGTGRSALLTEAAELARDARLQVITVRCAPADRARRYGIAGDVVTAVRGAGARSAGEPSGPQPPLALLVDDTQWADPHSQRWAHALTRRPVDRPLLLVFTGHGPVLPTVRAAARYELALRPLSRNGVRTLLIEAYGERSYRPLVPAAVAATGGNPAVLRATLHRCPAPAPAAGELGAVADQVGRDQVRRALAALPAQLIALLRASAVGSGDLSFRQVYEIAEVPSSCERARAELAHTGLLDDPARPRLRDPLMADRILGLMDGAERRELYVRAVRLGRRDGAPAPVLGRLVSHTRLTEAWVPRILHAAGAHARRSGDPGGAVALLERAVDRGATGALRAEVLLELAMAQTYVRPEAADRGFHRVLAEVTEPELSGPRLIAADVLALRGGGRAAACALASAGGRDTVPEAERRTLLGLHGLSAAEQPTAGQAFAPTGPVAPGGARTEPAPPPTDPAQAAAAAWRRCALGTEPHEARRLAAVALTRAAVAAGPLAPGLAAVRVMAVAEDMDAARAGLDLIEAEARRRGVRPAVGLAMLTRAELALRCGDLPRARARLAETVIEVPGAHWHPRELPRLTALGVLVDLESGLVDRAESALAAPLPDGHEYSLGWTELLFARGLLELCTGRTSEATTHLRECGRLLLNAGCTNPAVMPWRSHLALAQAATDPESATRLLADELATARAWGASGTVGAVYLRTALALPGPAAARHLRNAVRVLAGSPARARYAQAKVELAAVLLDDGQPANGRRMLREAMETLRVGGGRPTPRADEVAARYAALARTAQVRLTAAQLRVALFAAEGLPNKAIAQALSISLRAVELHLTNSYRALGISGRADLAAALGLGDGGTPTG